MGRCAVSSRAVQWRTSDRGVVILGLVLWVRPGALDPAGGRPRTERAPPPAQALCCCCSSVRCGLLLGRRFEHAFAFCPSARGCTQGWSRASASTRTPRWSSSGARSWREAREVRSADLESFFNRSVCSGPLHGLFFSCNTKQPIMPCYTGHETCQKLSEYSDCKPNTTLNLSNCDNWRECLKKGTGEFLFFDAGACVTEQLSGGEGQDDDLFFCGGEDGIEAGQWAEDFDAQNRPTGTVTCLL